MSEVEVLYRNLDATLKHVLRDMSNWGYIYLGRTGVGLTHSYRKETLKVGTIKACEEAKRFLSAEAEKLLEVICIEGPRWVPYKRLEDVFYGVDAFKSVGDTSSIKNNNNKASPPLTTPKTKTTTRRKKKKKEMKGVS